MIVLETMARLVTICGGVLASLFWLYTRLSSLRRENEKLREYISAIQSAPKQPAGADYVQDDQGNRICIHCYHSSQKQWKLIKETNGWRCPVCGAQSSQ